MNKHWIFDRIRANGAKPFLASKGVIHYYSDLLTEINKIGGLLSKKIPPGISIGLVGDYSLSAVAALLWLMQNKNIVVPITSSSEADIEGRMNEGYCRFAVSWEDNRALVVKARETVGENHELIDKLRIVAHSGLVLFSSGSSGRPKAMIHDLHNLVEMYSERKSRNLSMVVFLMFDHIGGINTLLNSLASGLFIVAPMRRDAEEVAELIERYNVNILPTSPTFLNLLLLSEAHRRHDLCSLKIITYGTEPMPESLLFQLRKAFPKVRFLQTFGTSETGISRTDSKSSDSLFMKMDDPDIEHKVVEGELWLRSRTQILGYLNSSMESFTPDGWFKTGDLVEIDTDGYMRIIGRSKEIINVGGEKVTPAEVESVILELTDVVDCTVFGMPSAITGQIVATNVVLKPGANPVVLKQIIRSHCSARLARYKIPVKVNFVETALFGERFKKKRF